MTYGVHNLLLAHHCHLLASVNSFSLLYNNLLVGFFSYYYIVHWLPYRQLTIYRFNYQAVILY